MFPHCPFTSSYDRIFVFWYSYDLRCFAAKAAKARSRPIKLSCVGICCFLSIKWSVPLAISARIFPMDSSSLFAEGTDSFVYYGLASSFNGPVFVDPPTHGPLLHSVFDLSSSCPPRNGQRNPFRSSAKFPNSSTSSSLSLNCGMLEFWVFRKSSSRLGVNWFLRFVGKSPLHVCKYHTAAPLFFGFIPWPSSAPSFEGKHFRFRPT